MSVEPIRIKRFYREVCIEAVDGAFALHLDGRQAKTQTRFPLVSPTLSLAEAIAGEWNAQADFIVRETMPLTAMQTATIDGGEGGRLLWCQDVLDYLGSDLLCYRADQPEDLVQRQAEVWDPYLDWFRSEFGESLAVTAGIMAIAQSENVTSTVRPLLEAQNAETLFALRMTTAISGSAILALAQWKGHADTSVIFDASRVDECFQEERWGADQEAQDREASLRSDFLTAGRFLALL